MTKQNYFDAVNVSNKAYEVFLAAPTKANERKFNEASRFSDIAFYKYQLQLAREYKQYLSGLKLQRAV